MTRDDNKDLLDATPVAAVATEEEHTGVVADELLSQTHEEDALVEPELEEDTEKHVLQYLTFADAPLNPRVREILKQINWNIPTPVQSRCLPFALTGREVAGFAQTGTGKTGVFLITLAHKWLSKDLDRLATEERVCPFALVLAPTRELAMQIESDGKMFFEKLSIRSLSVFGGSDWDEQANKLEKGVDVIVATPGRLKDFEQKGLIDLSKVQLFVCDEVDRMFEMGFVEDVEMILSKLSDRAQKLIFSATTNPKVEELSFQYLNRPEYISINKEEIAPEAIEQYAFLCETPDKFKLLLHLIRSNGLDQRSIVFTNTKLTAAWLEEKLKGNGIACHAITGDLPQPKRTKLIQQIKDGSIHLLIATDVASRGIHIPELSHVYNFDVPEDAANYIHRIGRTARAGAKGTSYVFVCDEYGANYLGIQRLLFKDAPVPVWPPKDFLQIEDLSGNPFEGNLASFLKDSSRGDRSPSHMSGRDNRDQRSFNRDQRDQKQSGNRQYDHERNGHQRNERRDIPEQVQNRPSASVKQTEQASGFIALIKKLFALLFSFGKNKDNEKNRRSNRPHNRSHYQDGNQQRNQRHHHQHRDHGHHGRHQHHDNANKRHNQNRDYGQHRKNNPTGRHQRDFRR